MKWLLCFFIITISCTQIADNKKNTEVSKNETKQSLDDSWESLFKEASNLGKEEWQPMLNYVAKLHKRSTHPAAFPFDYDWEEIGPGYVYGPAFGHWDVVHQIIDVMPSYPTHALHQLYNDVKNQEPSGLLPGSIWMIGGEDVPNMKVMRDKVDWNKKDAGHPPVWVVAVQDYVDQTGDKEVLNTFYTSLVRQITWFENERKAEGEGFFYNDILLKKWESGVDQGIRFDLDEMGAWACIDATSHVYLLYKMANKWSKDLDFNNDFFEKREKELQEFIQNDLYDKKFELRMWRGPTWNSMTYWAARGCLNYGRKDAAAKLLEKALDNTARIFDETGTIWEFYHPFGGSPEAVQRKPHTPHNVPCKDYLGHNPVIAMARMFELSKK